MSDTEDFARIRFDTACDAYEAQIRQLKAKLDEEVRLGIEGSRERWALRDEREEFIKAVHDAAPDVIGSAVMAPAYGHVTQAVRKLVDELVSLREDNAELNHLFTLQHTRMIEATELWRRENPGNDLVSPDLGDLLAWLMARGGRLRAIETAAREWRAEWERDKFPAREAEAREALFAALDASGGQS